jgi:hypothetical protein
MTFPAKSLALAPQQFGFFEVFWRYFLSSHQDNRDLVCLKNNSANHQWQFNRLELGN